MGCNIKNLEHESIIKLYVLISKNKNKKLIDESWSKHVLTMKKNVVLYNNSQEPLYTL